MKRLHLNSKISRSVRELNYAVQFAQKQLPVVHEELEQTNTQIASEQEKKKNIESERDKELKKLNEEKGAGNRTLASGGSDG